jgi:antitoxin VapB
VQGVKLFTNGGNQAVRLPKEFRFPGKDDLMQKVGDDVILLSHDKFREVLLHGVNSFSGDFLDKGREQGKNQEREDM